MLSFSKTAPKMHKGPTKPCSTPEDRLQKDREGQEAAVMVVSGWGGGGGALYTHHAEAVPMEMPKARRERRSSRDMQPGALMDLTLLATKTRHWLWGGGYLDSDLAPDSGTKTQGRDSQPRKTLNLRRTV